MQLEVERERGRSKGSDTPFKDTSSDLLPPTMLYLPIVHPAMNPSVDLLMMLGSSRSDHLSVIPKAGDEASADDLLEPLNGQQ